jgi:membrane protease YdiL (CAAX protease family)
VEKPSTSERSPLSPTHWPTDAFAWRRSLVAFLVLALAFGADILLASLTAAHFGVTRSDVQAERLSWGILIAQVVNYVLLVPALLFVLPWLARRSLADLGLRLPDARAVGGGIAGALAMYAVTIGIANVQFVLTHQKPQEAATALLTGTHDPLLAFGFGVLAVVIAPFVEELTFRGFLFNAVLRYTPVWVAALVSGAIFGLSHGSPTAFLPLAGSGVVLAYVYHRTGSLPASMITHALFNAVNVAQIASGLTT